jgi:hypothetical protein
VVAAVAFVVDDAADDAFVVIAEGVEVASVIRNRFRTER